jgi:hypothetical protein
MTEGLEPAKKIENTKGVSAAIGTFLDRIGDSVLDRVPGRSFMSIDALATGTFGSILVMLGSFQANSPFTSKIPGSWFIGVPKYPGPGNPFIELASNALVYLGLLLSVLAFVRLVLGLRMGERLEHPWLLFALWVAPLMIAGPLFSRDVYSYAAQGEMVHLGISPYKGGPALLGNSPFMATVDPLWGQAKAPYGPLFMMMDALIVAISGQSPLISVALLRLVALVSVAAIGFFVQKTAATMGMDTDLAFALSALNPVLLYTFASAGHNDAEMTALMVAGIYLFMRKRRLLGIVVVALAAAIKVPAIIALGFLGFNWSDSSKPLTRIKYLMLAVLIQAVVFVGLGWVSHLGLGWIPALKTPGSVLSFEDPIDLGGFVIGWLAQAFGAPFGPNNVVDLLRVLGDLGTLLIGSALILGSNRKNMLKLAGLALIVSVVLGPVIWPWYLGWGLSLLAITAGELTTEFLIALTISALPIDLLGAPTVLAWFGYLILLAVVYRHRDHLTRAAREAVGNARAVILSTAAAFGLAPSRSGGEL